MPTVNQMQRKLKRKVDTKEIIRELSIQSRTRVDMDETQEKIIQLPDVVWDNPPEVMKVRNSDIHKRVWIAGKPSTFDSKIYKIDMHEDDPDKDAQAHLLVTDRRSERGAGSYKSVFLDNIILHPEELTEDRLNEYYNIEDKRKS